MNDLFMKAAMEYIEGFSSPEQLAEKTQQFSLTDEMINTLLESYMIRLMILDVVEKEYVRIQKLCAVLNFKIEDLIRAEKMGIVCDLPFQKDILTDICYYISKDIASNSTVLEVFEDLYAAKYHRIYDEYLRLAKKNNNIESFINNYKTLDNIELVYYAFLIILHRSRYGGGNRILDYHVKAYYLSRDDNNIIHLNDTKNRYKDCKSLLLMMYQFDDTKNESVFDSGLFKKFVRNRKKDIAEYIGIEADMLEQYIYNSLTFNSGDMLNIVVHNIFDSVRREYEMSLSYYNGYDEWLQLMLKEGKVDLERIITDYYEIEVSGMIEELKTKGIDFPPIELNRSWRERSNPERELSDILHIFCGNLLIQLFFKQREYYYRNFSWESIVDSSQSVRDRSIIEELRNTISKKSLENAELKSRISIESSCDASDTKLIYEREINRLYSKIQQLEKENNKLKERVDNFEIFEKLQNEKEENNDFEIITPETLYGHKFLFVGRDHDNLKELKSLFPNSFFMQQESDSIKDVNYDWVVLLIRQMSHAMYYKIKNRVSSESLIYCNTKNVDRIIYDIYKVISD